MAAHKPRPRLRRSDCSKPGISRVRRGAGFSYLNPDGKPIAAADLKRVRGLVIPPAWKEVWICSDPQGHLQATGVDDAGRKQYLYHPRWREQRDRQKFDEMIGFARALPRLRRRVAEDLRDGPELGRDQVLACAVRLLDLGLFRIGGEEYADSGGSYGLATLQREHVTLNDGVASFDYPAKSGVQRVHTVSDRAAVELLRGLNARRGGPLELLAFRERRRWHPLHSHDITDYLKQRIGPQFSAKDFRTWNGTVLAAVGLAAQADADVKSRERVVTRLVSDVSAVLGNTPAVARRAYIDPRVIDHYLTGTTIEVQLPRALGEDLAAVATLSERSRRRLELAVLTMLG